MQRDSRTAWGSIDCILANQNPKMNDNGSATLRWYALKVYFNKVSDMEEMLGEENVECYVPYLDQVCAKEEDGSPDKPRGLSIQPCKSEKEEPYIRHSSQGRSECLYLRIE